MDKFKKETLKAKFQIGSVHGRVSYNQHERVFHQNDVPEKARTARESVLEFLEPRTEHSTDKIWDVTTHGTLKSGKYVSPWDESPHEDRLYKQQETRHRNLLKTKRVNMIRQGLDPDEDKKAINPPWQQSVALDPAYKRRYQEERQKHSPAPTRSPTTRMSLIDRQTMLSQAMINKKRQARRRASRGLAFPSSPLSTPATMNTSTGPHCTPTDRSPVPFDPNAGLDAKAITERLQEKYNPDTLAQFLETQTQELLDAQHKVAEHSKTLYTRPNLLQKQAFAQRETETTEGGDTEEKSHGTQFGGGPPETENPYRSRRDEGPSPATPAQRLQKQEQLFPRHSIVQTPDSLPTHFALRTSGCVGLFSD